MSILTALLLSVASPHTRAAAVPRESLVNKASNHLAGLNLVFEDNFDAFNFSTWSHEVTLGGGGNWEFEYYNNNRSNSFVRDGSLHIRPTLTADRIGEANVLNGYTLDLQGDVHSYSSCTDASFYGCSRTSDGSHIINPIQSASIKTISSFAFRYGVVEVRARLPKGDWLWPAIWMLPKSEKYGKWPASGEIDIMESRGNDASYEDGGVNSFGSTLHYGPYWPLDPWATAHKTFSLPTGKDFSQDYHVFGLLWNETTILTYLDDPSNVVLAVDTSAQSFWARGSFPENIDNPWVYGDNTNMAPFDQEFFLKINLAVGGSAGYFRDGIGGKPWKDTSPTAALDFWNARAQWLPTWDAENDASSLLIDYVRVYQ